MNTLFPDTRPEAERVQIELLRQAPPWCKLHMVGQMNQTVRTLALSGLRQLMRWCRRQTTRHPRRPARFKIGYCDRRGKNNEEQ